MKLNKVKVKSKQISVQLPNDLVARARAVAQRTRRDDGLKQTMSGTIRTWIMRGAAMSEGGNAQQQS